VSEDVPASPETAATLTIAQLLPSLSADFDVPAEDKDKYGNPIRKGADKETGMPLEIRHKRTGMPLVFIPAGEFLMGNPDGEQVHKVNLTKPYYLGKYEVTQAEWKAVMGNNPSQHPNDRSPVEMVNWRHCQAFVAELQPQAVDSESGAGFALPTEAQWEYACRAGTQTRFCFGDDPKKTELANYAWFKGNSGDKTHPVGGKKPNAWGLYDMHGNVGEWCQDKHGPFQASEAKDPSGPASGPYRVRRNGGAKGDRKYCQSAHRYRQNPTQCGGTLGFRVALNLSEQQGVEVPQSGTPKTDQDDEVSAAWEAFIRQAHEHFKAGRTQDAVKALDTMAGIPEEMKGRLYEGDFANLVKKCQSFMPLILTQKWDRRHWNGYTHRFIVSGLENNAEFGEADLVQQCRYLRRVIETQTWERIGRDRYTHKFIASALERDAEFQKADLLEQCKYLARLFETGAWQLPLRINYAHRLIVATLERDAEFQKADLVEKCRYMWQVALTGAWDWLPRSKYIHDFIVSSLEGDKDYQEMTLDEKRSRAKEIFQTGAWKRDLYGGYVKGFASTE